MPLLPVARPAQLDPVPGAVRFSMKDGARTVEILVSSTALENVGTWSTDDDAHMSAFKQHRKGFEQIASAKYDRGHVEIDGTVCIRTRDLSRVSTT